MNYRFGVVVDLETEKFEESAKKAQSEIERLEKRILELRKAKLDAVGSEIRTKLTKEISLSTIALKEQRIALREANNELRNRSAALQKAGTAQTQFRSQVGASNAVALEFNRIIQDAPFGIIGVGNNIQQLTANFAQLKATSGSTSAALKASLLSIVSPANLVLLGVSAITSAFTAYELGAFDSKEETENLQTAQEKLAESLKRTIDALNEVDSARVNGLRNAQSEITELELLARTVNDANKSQDERILAFTKLQEKYPKILGNMSSEEALAGGIAEQYKLITAAILERASVLAIEDKLIEVAKNRIELLEQERQQTNFQFVLEEERIRLLAERERLLGVIEEKRKAGLSENLEEIQQETAALNDVNSAITRVNKEFAAYSVVAGTTENEINKNKIATENLKQQYDELNLSLTNLLDPLEKTKDSIVDLDDNQKDYNSSIEEAIKNAYDYETALLKALKIQREIDPQTAFQRATQRLTGAEGDEAFSIVDVGDAAAGFEPEKIEQIKTFADFYKEAQNKITQSNDILIDSFSSLATQLGASFDISNRALRGFVTNLLNNTPKIIQAIVTTARANKAASEAGVVSAKKGALANGIFMATETGKSLGPIGLALLPVLIGGVVGLISGAFKSAGVSGGGAASSAVRSNAVGSSITGFGQAANPFGDLTLRTSIRGTDIELLLERVNVKSNA